MKDQATAPGAVAIVTGASAGDLAAVERLLSAAGLPLAGVRDQFPSAFSVARIGDDLVGVAALESYPGAHLLRSVAVAPDHQRRGLASRLLDACLARADQRPVYLLTESASAYFKSKGFTETARDQAPPALARSPEFASACPSSATCLIWRKPGTAGTDYGI